MVDLYGDANGILIIVPKLWQRTHLLTTGYKTVTYQQIKIAILPKYDSPQQSVRDVVRLWLIVW
jgi:hypothetical protein